MTALGDVSRMTGKRRTEGLQPNQIAKIILEHKTQSDLVVENADVLRQTELEGKDQLSTLAHVIRSKMLEESVFSF